ncbi:MAG: hypothetical protein IH933_09345 [Euryarchaeota archaeon]|nr:hypothetical protein [Euryarchaeota archaeon]
MSDSELREQLDEKHERNREQRLEAVKHWAQYIKENPPEDWGSQQNRLINSQLRSARESDLNGEHYRRVRERTR